MTFHPAQVTEREPDGTYEDCTWCTGVMLWNSRMGFDAAPNTRVEYEALRVAGGDGPAEKPGDGSNFGQLADGMAKRYGWRPPILVASFDEAWSRFRPGTAMGWQGSMGGVNDHLRRWDVNFGKGGRLAAHAALAIRDDDSDAAWWQNPLAPRSFPGERISKVMLRRYFESLPGAAVAYTPVGTFAPPDTSTGGEMHEHTTIQVLPFGGTFTVPANAVVTGFKFDEATGVIGARKTFGPRAAASSARYDAVMETTITRGDPFLRGIDGFFAGYYVAASEVVETPSPAPVADCAGAERAGAQAEWDRQAAGATAQVKLLPRPK